MPVPQQEEHARTARQKMACLLDYPCLFDWNALVSSPKQTAEILFLGTVPALLSHLLNSGWLNGGPRVFCAMEAALRLSAKRSGSKDGDRCTSNVARGDCSTISPLAEAAGPASSSSS